MTINKLLIVRGLLAILMTVFAVMAFSDGRTGIGVIMALFVIVNVVLIISIATKHNDFRWRLLGIFRARR
ncbi:MAG: hypothetical protein EXQ79_06960 [Acidimicrobiia bacterium]|nr:hypothetical protein [Acidimicrobiia bacterium]